MFPIFRQRSRRKSKNFENRTWNGAARQKANSTSSPLSQLFKSSLEAEAGTCLKTMLPLSAAKLHKVQSAAVDAACTAPPPPLPAERRR
eukprot:226396-Pleurochrysis_carterae.AAC.1